MARIVRVEPLSDERLMLCHCRINRSIGGIYVNKQNHQVIKNNKKVRVEAIYLQNE